jgi:hypothetical protein
MTTGGIRNSGTTQHSGNLFYTFRSTQGFYLGDSLLIILRLANFKVVIALSGYLWQVCYTENLM